MTRSRKQLAILTLLLLGLIVNGTFWFLTNRANNESSLLSASSISGEQLVAVSTVGSTDVLTANRKNEIAYFANGRDKIGQFTLEDTVGAIAGAADGTILVGTATGEVIAYAPDFTRISSVKVNGRILAISTVEGGYYVAHGVGAFGIRFYISYFDAGASEPGATFQVAQPVASMAPWQDGIVFGTANSNVGYFTASSPDAPVWTTQLSASISRVYTSPDFDGILVGNEKGGLSRLSADGSEVWTTSIGAYPVRGLNFDPATTDILVGDANGTFTVLSDSGTSVYSGAVGSNSDLEAIVQTGDGGWLIIPREGTWQILDPSAASSATNASTLRLSWAIANGILALLATGVIVAVIDSYRKSTLRTLRRIWKARIAYVFVLPAFILVVMFSYYPSAMAFYYSFTNYSLRAITKWVGFDNYHQILFEDPYFRQGIKNMLVITLTSIIKTLTIPLLIAELIFWLRNSWHSYIFRTLFILPTVVPGLVFTLMWRQIYDPDTGLINELLQVAGLDELQTAWLGNAETALWAIIGVGFPWVDAFALLILLGGLLNINADFFDAAKVDGASVWQRFKHVDMPLLVPQFRILLFFAIAGTVQGFVAIFILTRGGPGMTTYIPALQMYMRIADGDFGYASAVGVVLFLIILVATFLVLRLRRNDGVEAA